MQLVDVYRARVVDVSPESLVIETTGTEDKIDSLLEVLRPFGVLEMVRTGRIAMARGKRGARAVEALPGEPDRRRCQHRIGVDDQRRRPREHVGRQRTLRPRR